MLAAYLAWFHIHSCITAENTRANRIQAVTHLNFHHQYLTASAHCSDCRTACEVSGCAFWSPCIPAVAMVKSLGALAQDKLTMF